MPVADAGSLVVRVQLASVCGSDVHLWQGHLPPDGSFGALPSYWRGAAHWLDDRAGKGRTLVVPSASFAEYTWGRPLDEPMQALAKSDWAVAHSDHVMIDPEVAQAMRDDLAAQYVKLVPRGVAAGSASAKTP